MWKNCIAVVALFLLVGAWVTDAATTIVPGDSNLRAAPLIVATPPPAIAGFQPAGACVNKGATLIVQGRNFGAQSGKRAALGGHGIHVDLPIASWSNTSIAVSIPNDARIQSRQWYYIGIEKSDHSQWLSGIDKSITICSGSAAGVGPSPPSLATPPKSSGTGGDKQPPSATENQDNGASTSPATPIPGPAAGAPLTSALILPPPPKDPPPTPPKDSDGIEPGELVVVNNSMAEAIQLAARAQSLGLAVKRRTHLGGLGFTVTVFRAPKETGVGRALLGLRDALPQVRADANHRYRLLGDDAKTYAPRLIGWKAGAACGAGLRIGLVDTALDKRHVQFSGRRIQTREFVPNGVAVAKAAHGTATASLLTGRETGLIPGASLFAASIFRDRDGETDTTAEWVVSALNWLVEQRVALVNLSIGGPRNLLVEAAIQRLLARGIAVVAAAGNGGASAEPVFPAAQAGVVAVTAVDANLAVYRDANRGDYIAFAAPGVDVWAAALGKDGAYVSGTSYAAPFVTAALATARQANAKGAWTAIIKQLQATARDLGVPGRDPVFGWGLIRAPGCAAGGKKSG